MHTQIIKTKRSEISALIRDVPVASALAVALCSVIAGEGVALATACLRSGTAPDIGVDKRPISVGSPSRWTSLSLQPAIDRSRTGRVVSTVSATTDISDHSPGRPPARLISASPRRRRRRRRRRTKVQRRATRVMPEVASSHRRRLPHRQTFARPPHT